MNIVVIPAGSGTVKVTSTPVVMPYGSGADYTFEAQANPGYMLNSRRAKPGEPRNDWDISYEDKSEGETTHYTWSFYGAKSFARVLDWDDGDFDHVTEVKLYLTPAPKGILRGESWVANPKILRMDGSILRGNGV